MALTRLTAGNAREIWQETTPLNGGASVTITTGIHTNAAVLSRTAGILELEAVAGMPTITAQPTIVGGKLAVTITNTAFPGNAAAWKLDIWRNHSLNQGRDPAGQGAIHVVGAEAGIPAFLQPTAMPEMYYTAGDPDDTASIQAAANALTGTRGTLLLMNRTYVISSQITIPVGVSVVGQAVTPLMSTAPFDITDCGTLIVSAQVNAFNFLKLLDKCSLERVNFDASTVAAVPIAGIVIDASGAYGVRISRVTINRAYTGIALVNNVPTAQHTILDHVNVLNVQNIGILIDNAIDVEVSHGLLMNWGVTVKGLGKGMHILRSSATIWIKDTLFQSLEEGLRIKGADGGPLVSMVQDVHVCHCVFDGMAVIAAVVKYAKHATFSGCHFFSNNFYGAIFFDDYSVDITVSDGIFAGTPGTGIRLQGTTLPTSLAGINIHDNAFSFIAGVGVYVAPNTNDFQITGNNFRRTDPGTVGMSAMPYAVQVDTGTSDGYVIMHNKGRGASGGVLDNGSGVNKEVEDTVITP
jgi:hypothetical protein